MKKIMVGYPTRLMALLTLISALVLTMIYSTEAEEESSYAEAVGLMERERTLGEAGAGLLKTFANDDMTTLAQGIQRYALAQAHFNGLVVTLKGGLIKGEDLKESKLFQEALDEAVNRRVAFTDFLDQEVLSKNPQGTKSFAAVLGSADFLKGAAELLNVLKEAGLDIWREYRTANNEQRQQIKDQLDSLKWRSYDKVPPLG